MRKVLIVTYFWPPAGGPGVQRILKFVKYLPQFGWEPIVLTVEEGEYPAIDETLAENIPHNCKVYKTKSIEPFKLYKKFIGKNSNSAIPTAVLSESKTSMKKKIANWIRLNLFIPDAKIGWMYSAVGIGEKIIRKERPSIIFSTSPPPTVHLIAKKLAEKTNLKWVADFRDPWTDIHYYENQPRLSISKKVDDKLEYGVLNKADRITCISKYDIIEDFGKKTDSKKCINIPNGYDEDDFQDVNTNYHDRNVFTMLHLGAVNEERKPNGLFKAISNLKSSGFLDPSVFRFYFVGNIEESVKNLSEEMNISELISFISYMPHKESLKFTERASLLVLLVTNSKKNNRILPGKTFEYLRSNKFILACGPKEGEVSRILNETKSGIMVDYSDTEEIEKIIKQQFNSWHKDIVDHITSSELIQKYSRESLTEQLATTFNNTLHEVDKE